MGFFNRPSPAPAPQSAPVPTPDPALEFLLAERVSPQWSGFLDALTHELREQLSPEDLRALLRSVGQRFGAARPIEAGESVEELQRAVNGIWNSIRWGYAELRDGGDVLHITHHLSPLGQALGEGSAEAAAGFLEGVYESWMHHAGAADDLSARAAAPQPGSLAVSISFGKL